MKRVNFLTAAFPLAIVLLTPVEAAQRENLSFKPPSGWGLANAQQTGDTMLMEFVKKGEKLQNWSELVSVQQFRRGRNASSPRQYYDAVKQSRDKRCPGLTEWGNVEEEEGMFLYEWRTTAECDGHPPQSELTRLVFARDTGYRVAFATKAPMTEELRATWREWLRSLRLAGPPAPVLSVIP